MSGRTLPKAVYQGVGSFSTLFRKRTGCSPQQFREAAGRSR